MFRTGWSSKLSVSTQIVVWNPRGFSAHKPLTLVSGGWLDTHDGFRERVNEQELIKWGESFGIGLEMTLTEAMEALENVGYKVEKLEEKEILGEWIKWKI